MVQSDLSLIEFDIKIHMPIIVSKYEVEDAMGRPQRSYYLIDSSHTQSIFNLSWRP